MTFLYTVLLLGQQTGGAQGGPGQYMNLVFIVGMVAVFYFFMIRPQAQKAKNQKTFLESLNKGDKIVTIAGMHGRITRINDNGTLEVEIDNNVKVVMERSGISLEFTKAVQNPGGTKPEVKK
jgi:preprotein translocase subunit YajC